MESFATLTSSTVWQRFALLVGVLTLAAGCGRNGETGANPSSEAGSGGSKSRPVDAGGVTGRGGRSHAAEGGFGGGVDAGAKPADDFWTPTGDPKWAAVDWAPGCLIEAATRPEHAMPELVWTDCEGLAGCQRLDPNWYVRKKIYLGFANGYRKSNRSSLGVGTAWGDGAEWRFAVYDQTWRPKAVWRGNTGDCNGVALRPTPWHVCFLSAKSGGPAVAGLFRAEDLTGTPLLTYTTKGRLSEGCTADLAISFNTVGRSFIYDFNLAHEVELSVPTGEAFIPESVGPAAFFSRSYANGNGKQALDGWVWSPSLGAKPLIDPTGKFVADIRSDGESLAWLELDMTSISFSAAGTLWSSPATLDKASVSRRLVREVPSTTITMNHKAIGGGFYAMLEQHTGDQSVVKLHVYRLADGRHWQVPTPPDLLPGSIVWLDSDEILFESNWLSGASYGLIRQDLSQLGDGD